jgi:hypothetical protein
MVFDKTAFLFLDCLKDIRKDEKYITFYAEPCLRNLRDLGYISFIKDREPSLSDITHPAKRYGMVITFKGLWLLHLHNKGLV